MLGCFLLQCQHVRVHIKKTHRAAATPTISSSLCACRLITVSFPLASHYPSQTSRGWVAVVSICMPACLNAPVQCWGSNPGPCARCASTHFTTKATSPIPLCRLLMWKPPQPAVLMTDLHCIGAYRYHWCRCVLNLHSQSPREMSRSCACECC